ncbi:MAG TPA: aquaporin [Roseimicrobium sp.]|nr:aquaporin [Roseimicrobium sp.]
MKTPLPALLAEMFGTFALVFAGTGAIVINHASGGAITHVGIALTFGLVVFAMIRTFGDISGSHLNPAVTLAFWSGGKFQARDVAPYIVMQCIGAFAASGLLRFLFPADPSLGATLPVGNPVHSLILEFLLTFILMQVILNAKDGALPIGATVGLEAMFAGPICGASMNPARSLAPAVVSGHTEHLWIYLVATTAGACVAVVVQRWLRPISTSSIAPNP